MHEVSRNKSLKNKHSFKLILLLILLVLLSMTAICSLLIFQVEVIHWVLLNFPEVEFLIAAALILVGLHRVKEKNHFNDR